TTCSRRGGRRRRRASSSSSSTARLSASRSSSSSSSCTGGRSWRPTTSTRCFGTERGGRRDLPGGVFFSHNWSNTRDMYDALTTSYVFSCPARGETKVRLSDFGELGRLPGPSHPGVYRIRFRCGCGDEHEGLLPHDDLDWAPIGGDGGSFLNLMTARIAPVAEELTDLAARRILAGEWPWSFFCYPEERPRPIFPSSFVVLAPGGRRERIAVAVRCPACGATSGNLVTHEHVDLPFFNDAEIGVVEHV